MTRHSRHSNSTCTDPTYPTAPLLNPTCMAQFNETGEGQVSVRGCKAEMDAQAAEIAMLRARLAELESVR